MVFWLAKDLFVFTSERQPKTIFVNCSASLIKDFTLATLHVKRCDGHGALWKACDPVDSADFRPEIQVGVGIVLLPDRLSSPVPRTGYRVPQQDPDRVRIYASGNASHF
jgi:hypothetical protein